MSRLSSPRLTARMRGTVHGNIAAPAGALFDSGPVDRSVPVIVMRYYVGHGAVYRLPHPHLASCARWDVGLYEEVL